MIKNLNEKYQLEDEAELVLCFVIGDELPMWKTKKVAEMPFSESFLYQGFTQSFAFLYKHRNLVRYVVFGVSIFFCSNNDECQGIDHIKNNENNENNENEDQIKIKFEKPRKKFKFEIKNKENKENKESLKLKNTNKDETIFQKIDDNQKKLKEIPTFFGPLTEGRFYQTDEGIKYLRKMVKTLGRKTTLSYEMVRTDKYALLKEIGIYYCFTVFIAIKVFKLNLKLRNFLIQNVKKHPIKLGFILQLNEIVTNTYITFYKFSNYPIIRFIGTGSFIYYKFQMSRERGGTGFALLKNSSILRGIGFISLSILDIIAIVDQLYSYYKNKNKILNIEYEDVILLEILELLVRKELYQSIYKELHLSNKSNI